MMDRLFVVGLERDLDNSEIVVFEQNLVVSRRGGDCVERRIPARWIR
jgi:hypothetical protein